MRVRDRGASSAPFCLGATKVEPSAGPRGGRSGTGTDVIWAAAAVHLFTALGAVAAFFAAIATYTHDAEGLFFWLAVALVIDGIDGTFARAVGVRERLPRYSGETLDLVVDFVTYVFVPVLALIVWGNSRGISAWCSRWERCCPRSITSPTTRAKTPNTASSDFRHCGNLVAFYVFAFGLGPAATAILSALCIVGAFLPMPWVHPLRVRTLRGVTLAVMAAGTLAGISVLYHGFPASGWAEAVLRGVSPLWPRTDILLDDCEGVSPARAGLAWWLRATKVAEREGFEPTVDLRPR